MNNASDVLQSVQEVPLLTKRLFGIEIDFYDMLELLPIVLRDTGSIAIRPKMFKGTIKDFYLQVPCDLYAVKYVCTSKPMSWYSAFLVGDPEQTKLINYRVDQSGNLGAYNPDASTFDSLNNETTTTYEVNKNVFSAARGRFIDFKNEDNKCLHFNFKEMEVDVLYISAPLDADGYPKLPEKTILAVAYYLNYVEMRKRFNLNTATDSQWRIARDEKDQRVANARTPTFLSDNEMDDVLNVLTSMNRKRHNVQFRGR